MTLPTNSALLSVALDAAHAGAAIVRDAAPRVRSIAWRTKQPSDFVSEVDLAAEAAIATAIRRALPDAFVHGEESVASATTPVPANGVVFVVDPLDGTTNFLHGYPEYAVSVGVLVDGALAAGVVIDVALGEVFTATAGGGAFSNGTPLSVSTIGDPARALIGTGFPFSHPERVEPYVAQLGRVMRDAAGIRRAGAAALDLAAVAAGRFEAFWETVLSPWDIAAGILLVREAGGLATDLAGAPCPVARTGIVAGNRAMHGWLIGQLRANG